MCLQIVNYTQNKLALKHIQGFFPRFGLLEYLHHEHLTLQIR